MSRHGGVVVTVDTGGEFIWGVPLGCLGHEAGKGRLTSWGKGSAVEPRIDAQQIEGDRAEDVLQMRLGLAEVARAAQPADAYGLALAWHATGGHGTPFPLDALPTPWNWLYYGLHALAYTAVLFLAGIFGERPKSAKEVVLATQRALEQQALERWRMQKEAQIEAMLRRGEPLGGVAAALASPETAERIAVLEAATSGGMSALDAAWLNVRRAGHDLSLLEGLRGAFTTTATAPMAVAIGRTSGGSAEAEGARGAVQTAEELLRPLGLGRHSEAD